MPESAGQLLLLLLLLLAFFLLVVRPQRTRLQQARQVRAALAVGQQVMTTSGLFGTLRGLDDAEDTVLLEVAPGVQVRWAAGAVAKVLEPTAERAPDRKADPRG